MPTGVVALQWWLDGQWFLIVWGTALQAPGSGSDPVPVAYRYNVLPEESFMTNVFKPNTITAGSEVKHAQLGGALGSKYHLLLKNNPRAVIAYEVSWLYDAFLNVGVNCFCDFSPLTKPSRLSCEAVFWSP